MKKDYIYNEPITGGIIDLSNFLRIEICKKMEIARKVKYIKIFILQMPYW